MVKDKVEVKKARRLRIKKRIRKKIFGTAERPRLTVYKSNRYIYVQAIDDERGVTLAAASTLEKEFRENHPNTKNKEAAAALGKIIAERLLAKGVKTVVFDRNGYPYHGRVKALADAAREAGLKF